MIFRHSRKDITGSSCAMESAASLVHWILWLNRFNFKSLPSDSNQPRGAGLGKVNATCTTVPWYPAILSANPNGQLINPPKVQKAELSIVRKSLLFDDLRCKDPGFPRPLPVILLPACYCYSTVQTLRYAVSPTLQAIHSLRLSRLSNYISSHRVASTQSQSTAKSIDAESQCTSAGCYSFAMPTPQEIARQWCNDWAQQTSNRNSYNYNLLQLTTVTSYYMLLQPPATPTPAATNVICTANCNQPSWKTVWWLWCDVMTHDSYDWMTVTCQCHCLIV